MSSKKLHVIFRFWLVCVVFWLPGCKSETPVAGLPNGNAPTALATPTPTPATSSRVASVNSTLYLKVERALPINTNGATGNRILVGTCLIPVGTAPLRTNGLQTNMAAEGTAGSAMVDCGPLALGSNNYFPPIPEGDLYYSHLYFTVGSNDPITCAKVVFKPYYYLGSVSPIVVGPPVSGGFFAPWLLFPALTRNDCTSPYSAPYPNTPSACFNGPAVSLVPGFNPFTLGVQFHTNTQLESVFDLNSAYDSGQNSNRYTVNLKSSWNVFYKDPFFRGDNDSVGDTAAAGAGYFTAPQILANYGVGYNVGYSASHQDYVAECHDTWDDIQFTVLVLLSDQNSANSGNGPDDHHAWP